MSFTYKRKSNAKKIYLTYGFIRVYNSEVLFDETWVITHDKRIKPRFRNRKKVIIFEHKF